MVGEHGEDHEGAARQKHVELHVVEEDDGDQIGQPDHGGAHSRVAAEQVEGRVPKRRGLDFEVGDEQAVGATLESV